MDLFDGRYKKEDLIGRGAFSEVWRVTDTYTNTVMALKIFTSNSDIDEDGLDMLKREFALMIDADHQNLLRPMFFGVSAEGRQPYLTLPYCKGGNINKMMGRMTERDAWKLIRDTSSALAYLHAMNPPIIHQDIKPANILMGNDGYYKLSDFGVSIHARSAISKTANGESAYNSAGTISYMAPEKFSEDNLPIMANDIYSLGATVYEMLSGYLPFGPDGGLTQKKGADIPNLPGDYSMHLKQTIKDCLNAEPWERPTAAKLEETAIDALSKAPTVMIKPITPDQEWKQEEPEADYSFRTRAEKKSKSLILIIGLIVAVLVVLALLLFLPKQEDKPEVITTEHPQEQEPVVFDPVPSVEPPVQNVAPPVQKKEPPVQKDVQPVKRAERVTDVVIEKPQRSSKTLDLGYATWEGKSINGKPDGYGIMTYHNAHRIDSRDDQGRVAQSGDKVKGNFINGHLEYGTWIKAGGGQEEIFIGQ